MIDQILLANVPGKCKRAFLRTMARDALACGDLILSLDAERKARRFDVNLNYGKRLSRQSRRD